MIYDEAEYQRALARQAETQAAKDRIAAESARQAEASKAHNSKFKYESWMGTSGSYRADADPKVAAQVAAKLREVEEANQKFNKKLFDDAQAAKAKKAAESPAAQATPAPSSQPPVQAAVAQEAPLPPFAPSMSPAPSARKAPSYTNVAAGFKSGGTSTDYSAPQILNPSSPVAQAALAGLKRLY